MRWVGALVLALTRGWYTVFARTGGNFVVYVVDGSTSVASRYHELFGLVRSSSVPNNMHITLAMFALAFLTVLKVAGQKRGPKFRSKKPLRCFP
jgi:hypothetical protein